MKASFRWTASIGASLLHVSKSLEQWSIVAPGPRRCHTRVIVGALILFVSTGCSAPNWVLDPGFGERLAKQENKPLLFYFKAWDSTQHRNMQLKVFNNPEIRKELLDTVNVELEFGWSDPYKTRYGVSNPQVCVMCNPNGRKVGTALYANPVPTVPKFLEWIKRVKQLAVPAPTSKPAGALTERSVRAQSK